jgi:hypothetical protein
MAFNLAIFVSKRLQRPAAAIACLLMAQMLVTLSDCHPEHVPMGAAARTTIGR